MSKTERATVNLGGLLACTLFALALATQGSQGLFQINPTAADYAALLISRAPFLRADLGLDFIFIIVRLLRLACAGLEAVGRRPAVSGQRCDRRQYRDCGAVDHRRARRRREHPHPRNAVDGRAGEHRAKRDRRQMVESQIKVLFSYFGVFVVSLRCRKARSSKD
jgi:hypothetical protein